MSVDVAAKVLYAHACNAFEMNELWCLDTGRMMGLRLQISTAKKTDRLVKHFTE